jgi:ParB/RepB/Spo0J family partition protein
MSGLSPVKIKLSDLSEDPANVRSHNEKNILAIMQSLEAFGQQKPIVVDKSNVIRAGNGTFRAAKRLGWKELSCCVSELTGSEMIAYSIADNRTAELADWDMAQLIYSIEEIESESKELLQSIGFTAEEIAAMAPCFEPGSEDDQGQLDQLDAKMATCPRCKMEFDRREQK